MWRHRANGIAGKNGEQYYYTRAMDVFLPGGLYRLWWSKPQDDDNSSQILKDNISICFKYVCENVIATLSWLMQPNSGWPHTESIWFYTHTHTHTVVWASCLLSWRRPWSRRGWYAWYVTQTKAQPSISELLPAFQLVSLNLREMLNQPHEELLIKIQSLSTSQLFRLYLLDVLT